MTLKELAAKYKLNLIDLRLEMQRQIDFRIFHQKDLTDFELNKVETFILENLLVDQEAPADQFNREEFDKEFKGPIEILLKKYNPIQIRFKSGICGLKISPEMNTLLEYLNSTSQYSLINALPEIEPFEPQEIVRAKKNQYDYSLNENNITSDNEESWDHQVTLMWLAAEMAFEEICLREKLIVVDLNKDKIEPISPQDYEVNGKLIDVKSRCLIGSTIDRHHKRTICNPNEIIAFFNCWSNKFKSKVKTQFLGIFDPKLIESLNLRHVHIDTTHFLNPLFFVNHQAYFGVKSYEELPLVDQNTLRTIIKIGKFELSKCFSFYDRTSVIDGLIDIGYFKGHEEIAKELRKLSAIRKEYLGPTILFDYLTGLIKQTKVVDIGVIKDRILNFCCLNDVQYEYVTHYLNVLSIIQDERNVCQFTQIPLKKCKIDFSDDFKSIYAKSPLAKFNQSNTLMSYSWLTGDILSYGANGTLPCTYEDCGCLVHLHDWNTTIGKKSCKLHGKAIYDQRSKRFG